jgi:hypothetical protein
MVDVILGLQWGDEGKGKIVIRQSPARLDAKEGIPIAPECEVRSLGVIALDPMSKRRSLKDKTAVADTLQIQEVGTGEIFLGKGHLSSGKRDLLNRAIQEIAGSHLAPISAGG